MNDERLMQILLAPLVTEKAASVGEHRQYVFEVARDASKSEIKQAVHKMFDVEVETVRLCNVKPKHKMFKGRPGVRSGWKKAYVKLREGASIEFTGAES